MKTKNQNRDNCQTIEYLHTQAVNHHKENKLNEALALYLQSIELEKNQPAWIYGNAITLSAQIGDYDLGVELKHKAETIYPDSSEVQRSIGLLFEKLNDFDSKKGTFQAWIYSIARNTVIDHYRTKKSNANINENQP